MIRSSGLRESSAERAGRVLVAAGRRELLHRGMRRASISLAVLLCACGATSSPPAGDATSAPAGGAASDDPSAAGQTSSYPALRYLENGEPLGALGTDGRITLEGGEHAATLRGDSQVVDHEGDPLLSVTSEGRVILSSGDDAPMLLVDGQLELDGRRISIDEAGHFRYGEHRLELSVEGYQPGLARTVFLGWIALRFAPIVVQRRLPEEARQNLEAIYTQVTGTGTFPSAAPRTPATIPCGETLAWPASAPPAFAALGIGFADPVRYAYSIEVDGDAFVLRAEGDLDCDGVTSRFELHGRRTADGFTREPGLRVVDELE